MTTDFMKKAALFAGGVLFGTAGIKALCSKDAKKVYVQTTAAALRVKECVMNTATSIQEGAEDILAEAKEVNINRAAEEEVFEDESEETVEEEAENQEKEATSCES